MTITMSRKVRCSAHGFTEVAYVMRVVPLGEVDKALILASSEFNRVGYKKRILSFIIFALKNQSLSDNFNA